MTAKKRKQLGLIAGAQECFKRHDACIFEVLIFLHIMVFDIISQNCGI
jgi:hypothetical protein